MRISRNGLSGRNTALEDVESWHGQNAMRRVIRKSDVSWDDFPYRKDEDGVSLCRKCAARLSPPKTAWCSSECVKAVKAMTDWVYIRHMILIRDAHQCVKCGLPANEVDHIVEIANGGSFWQQDNLQTLCREHHREKTSLFNRGRIRKPRVHIPVRKILPIALCVACSGEFQPHRKDNRFCSHKCRQKVYMATMFQKVRDKQKKRRRL